MFFLVSVLAFVVLVAIPAYLVISGNGKKLRWQLDMSNTVSVRVNASRKTCSKYIRNVDHLMAYEQKVVESEVVSLKENGLIYKLSGHVLGAPWTMTFCMQYRGCGGFYSRVTGGLFCKLFPEGFPSGGFYFKAAVNEDSQEEEENMTEVFHYERYRLWTFLPFAFVLAPIFRAWNQRGMEVEMEGESWRRFEGLQYCIHWSNKQRRVLQVVKVEMEAMQRGEKPPEVVGKYGVYDFVSEIFRGCEPFTHYPRVV